MSRIRSDELYSLIFYTYLCFPRNEEKKKWRKKKKRVSADVHKCEPQKGKRLLKKYRRPCTDRMLPKSLGRDHIVLSVGKDRAIRMGTFLATELLKLEGAKDLEDYSMTDEMKAMISPGNIHNCLRTRCTKFCDAYERMIREVIAPHIVKQFSPQNENDRFVLYQFPPTVRIYCSHLKPIGGKNKTDEYRSLGRFHCDAQYGHQDGEINFWMPLTVLHDTSTLWGETEPMKEDYYPFRPEIGEIVQFPGTNCRHFTKSNVSGKTRVSIDFRCSTRSCFDKTWSLPGMTHRHEMREFKVRRSC
eukprot:g6306.t1